MAKISKDDVLSYLETANMLEISELIKDIEDKFNVSAAVPVAVAGGAAQGASAEVVAEEKSDFKVELTVTGDKKIAVIKVIREVTSLGLKEAKELADGAPSVVKDSAPKEEAEELKAKLEEAGATVTLS
jgi:large subunit ribosomal protein L7/L12|tara:strand:+ start:4074 stop:4460 length:387 start_codon:yes stop_codon:yes gene_type:complete